jgi:hypothetical protein
VALCPFCRMRERAEGEEFCSLCQKIAKLLVKLGRQPKMRIGWVSGWKGKFSGRF